MRHYQPSTAEKSFNCSTRWQWCIQSKKQLLELQYNTIIMLILRQLDRNTVNTQRFVASQSPQAKSEGGSRLVVRVGHWEKISFETVFERCVAERWVTNGWREAVPERGSWKVERSLSSVSIYTRKCQFTAVARSKTSVSICRSKWNLIRKIQYRGVFSITARRVNVRSLYCMRLCMEARAII